MKELENRRNGKILIFSGLLFLLGVAIVLAGIMFWPANKGYFIFSVLQLNILWAGIPLFGGVFIAIHALSRSGWYVSTGDLPGYLILLIIPVTIVFFLLVPVTDHIFPWAGHNAGEIRGTKRWYYGSGFFFLRTTLILVVWNFLLRKMKKSWLKKPLDYKGIKKYSGWFLVSLGLFISPFAWDWVISLDIYWHSTIFAWYILAGILLTGISVMNLVFLILIHLEILDPPGKAILNMGRYQFVFSIIWAYLWYSQFMLIWYGNIPEETAYYLDRLQKFPVMVYLNPILCFAVPFILLISPKGKSNRVILMVSAMLCLAGQWIDKFLAVMKVEAASRMPAVLISTGLTLIFLVTLAILIIVQIKPFSWKLIRSFEK